MEAHPEAEDALTRAVEIQRGTVEAQKEPWMVIPVENHPRALDAFTSSEGSF